MEHPDFERWRDRPPGGSSLEDLAGERLREVQVPELSELQLARVSRRISDAIDPAPRWRLTGLRWAALAILLGSTVTAGAAIVGVRVVRAVRLAQEQRRVVPVPGPTHASPAAVSSAPAADSVLEVVQTPPEPAPPPLELLLETGTASETPAVRRGTPTRHTGAPAGLTGESRMLHAALEQMNVRGDATSALAQLDSYRIRYPTGVLSREADVARVDALLRLGREADALDLLDGAADKGFEGYPRPGQLRVLRGELLARLGRCGEAIPIFTSALADPQAGQSAERALYGRAHCRATLGEMDGSRSDLDRYLTLYPQGHFAAEARRALAK
jgi:hypothetical protein